jgi:tetratricopeptide (TPR) repeat protein
MEDAITFYKKVMELDSTQTCTIYSSLITTYYDQKKIKEGLDLLDEKVKKGCAGTYSEYFLGMYYAIYSTKEYERAIKYCDEYIKLVPNGADGYYFKANAQTQLDDVDNPKWLAKEAHEKLIGVYEAKPEDTRAKGYVASSYAYMGLYYGSQQDLVKAKEYFQKALAIDPANKLAANGMAQLEGNK